MQISDDLSLIIGDRKISGWTSVRVTRGIERIPSDFDISLTQRSLGGLSGIFVAPGASCKVLLGDDLVAKGYIDRFLVTLNSSQHQIRICGRGKCEDLVDCSAEWPGSQLSGTTALGIVKRLAEPYGISVSGLSGPSIPQFNLNFGETAWEVIERVCRFSGLLAIEQADGNLLLTHAGFDEHSSGFAQGENIEDGSAEFSMDQRYSEYVVYSMGANMFSDAGSNPMSIKKVEDIWVGRHRRKAIVADSGAEGTQQQLGIARAYWEQNRRQARSSVFRLTADSWRDSKGKLWEPNKIVELRVPGLREGGDKLVISEVSYLRNENGTHADVTLMPAGAFRPEPFALAPIFPDIPNLAFDSQERTKLA